MGQFTVYRNANPDTQDAYPLLLDVQSGLLASLTTRVVVPLCPASTIAGVRMKTLMPIFDIAGQRYVMLTPQLAGIAKRQLGEPVADLTACRAEIIAALDWLLTGI
jgi:toxin CcdB